MAVSENSNESVIKGNIDLGKKWSRCHWDKLIVKVK